MYYSYYGLKGKPFELAPDGSYVFMSETHKEGLATLRYGVLANKGFLLLTGGVGVGKTTLLNALLKTLQSKVIVCLLNNPTLTKKEFFHYLANHFALPYKKNKSVFIIHFKKLLTSCGENGEKILLVIDEAQAFSIDLLEEIRLLSNLAGESNVLSIFLVGQPEIREKLATNQLLPLRQRIGIRYHIEPLSHEDTKHYIYYRLNLAGAGETSIFTEQAIDILHEASQGNPRLINILCDLAMLSGFARNLKNIDRAVVLECIDEIRIPGEATLQTSEVSRAQTMKVLHQSNTQLPSVEKQPRLSTSEVAREPKPHAVEDKNTKKSQASEIDNRGGQLKRPVVHFLIALVLMSVIIVLGVMIPTEATNFFSGAN